MNTHYFSTRPPHPCPKADQREKTLGGRKLYINLWYCHICVWMVNWNFVALSQNDQPTRCISVTPRVTVVWNSFLCCISRSSNHPNSNDNGATARAANLACTRRTCWEETKNVWTSSLSFFHWVSFCQPTSCMGLCPHVARRKLFCSVIKNTRDKPDLLFFAASASVPLRNDIWDCSLHAMMYYKLLTMFCWLKQKLQ